MRNRSTEKHPKEGQKKSSPRRRKRVGSKLSCSTLRSLFCESGTESSEHAYDKRVGGSSGTSKEDRGLGSARYNPPEHQQRDKREQCERGYRKTKLQGASNTEKRRTSGNASRDRPAVH